MVCTIAYSVKAQTTAMPVLSKKEVKHWWREKEWLGGWKVAPHKTIDKETFARQYQLNKEGWDKAFAFLKSHDLKTLAKGRHEIDGDKVYASVTENPSRDWDSTNWESHRNYIDLQYVIEGEEKIGVHPVSRSTVTKPYDPKKDVANYAAEGKLYTADPSVFFLFFPGDAHRPNITPGGNKVVKKIVIKVRVAGDSDE
jgi:YhcH/YjgK/YiaL family protein